MRSLSRSTTAGSTLACGAGKSRKITKDGAGKRNRTSDLLITNQLLYRLSYSGVGREF